MIVQGNAVEVLRSLPNESVHCCLTSPPYFNLRRYCGQAFEIGLEESSADYITNLAGVFAEVKRVLRGDGTLWIVIDDTYSDKSLALIPQRLEVELSASGWIIRNQVIWRKPNCVPASVKDRFTVDYETLIFATKSRNYRFDQQFEPQKACSIARLNRARSSSHKSLRIPGQTTQGINRPRGRGEGDHNPNRNMRTTWDIATKGSKLGHFAVFPGALAERCLRAGCPKGGVVLDPFAGSGSTGIAAKRMGIDYILVDLNPDYCRMMRQRGLI